MEFLLVIFAGTRGVIVDTLVQGKTNVVLELAAGAHDVTLEPPPDFSPVVQHVVLAGTAVLDPCRITFELLPARVASPQSAA